MAPFGGAIQENQNIAKAALAQPEDIRARHAAAEDVIGAVNADMGKAGTYDMPPPSASLTSNPIPTITANSTPPVEGGMLNRDGYNFTNKNSVKKYDKLIKKGFSPEDARAKLGTDQFISEDSIFDRVTTGTGAVGGGGKSGTGQTSLVVNKDRAKAQIESGSMFRQTSRMVAESEQMLSRSGPLYDEMMQASQLPIIEGAAAAARENTESIRTMLAAGGSQRRAGFEAISKIRAQDAINVQKGQALAQNHLAIDQWVRDNAKNVINFAQNFTQNQAGVRESFMAAGDYAASLMESGALPLVINRADKNQELREAASAQQRGKVNRWITGVLGLAEGVMTAYRGGDASGSNQQFADISGDRTVTNTASLTSSAGNATGSASFQIGGGSGQRTLMGDIKGVGQGISDTASNVGNYLTGGS